MGGGGGEGWCVLLSAPGEAALERLRIFQETADGFAIARADLRMRGQGDLFGPQQHGRDPVLRFADLTRDEGLLMEAQRRARALVEADPALASPANQRIRELLQERYAERLKMFAVG